MYQKIEVVRELLQANRMSINRSLFLAACLQGDLAEVERLLPLLRLHATVNEGLCIASECGQVDIVQRLLKDPRITPSANQNKAMRLARANGHNAIVECLSRDARVAAY